MDLFDIYNSKRYSAILLKIGLDWLTVSERVTLTKLACNKYCSSSNIQLSYLVTLCLIFKGTALTGSNL